jgi:hypothetical protein
MKHVKRLGLALVVALTLAVLGCTGAGGTPPSSADAARALGAMGTAVGAAPAGESANYGTGNTCNEILVGANGTIQVSYTKVGDFTTGPASMTGTMTFIDLHDPMTGYTFNGTVGISEATTNALTSYPLTLTIGMTCNLTLTGGPVSTLSCNISESVTFSDSVTPPTFMISGTLTANGYTFDVTKL